MSERKSYSLKFKVEVIKKAELSSNRSAADFYQINDKQVRKWRYDKAKINDLLDIPGDRAQKKERKRLVGGGRRHFLDESSILNNIKRNRQKNYVSCKMIKTWALNKAQSTDVQNFCASRGWLSRFLVRNKLPIRRRATTGQNLPTQLSLKIVDLILYNKRQRELCQF